MKTLLALAFIVAASANSLPAQGRVLFNNFSSGPFPINQFWPFIYNAWPGSDYQIRLLWVPGSATHYGDFFSRNPSASPTITFFGTTGIGTPDTDGAGFFDGGTVPIGPTGIYTLLVEAKHYSIPWGAGGAPNGVSSLFTMDVTAFPTPALNTLIPYFELGRIPEPSVLSLAVLSLAACLLCRRRHRAQSRLG